MTLALSVARTLARVSSISLTMTRRLQYGTFSNSIRMFGSTASDDSKTSNYKKKEDNLYDPYKIYSEKKDGNSKGELREFNPDHFEYDDLVFTWEEPEEMMQDKSWPSTTGNTELFVDLLNVPREPPSEEKMQLILKETFKRMGHQSIKDIQLPQIEVEIPQEDPDREAMEIMKLALENNGRIKMEDKNEIMQSLIDEIQHLRRDKTELFKGLD
jgi:hypothetical protein